jgi:hypothetical protein
MDNQQSQPLLKTAARLLLQWELVPPYVKNPNRAERAIRTAENHMIATRAGFHPDCLHAYLDKCLCQIELTLNIVRPFDYDPSRSAYEGLTNRSYDFQHYPIAPVGSKVLTWNSPSHRGSWADHGVEAVYLGPAENHLRSFDVWVPNTSSPRVIHTVWWFLHDNITANEGLLLPDRDLAYPPSKARPFPRDNGTDLIGRAFLEPELGVCIITGAGPVVHNKMASRARLKRNRSYNEPLLPTGAHYTLMYHQITTGEEHYSYLSEILCWIENGPILRPPTDPVSTNDTDAPITTPSYVPASIQYVTNVTPQASPTIVPHQATTPPNADTIAGDGSAAMAPGSQWSQKRVSLSGTNRKNPHNGKSSTRVRGRTQTSLSAAGTNQNAPTQQRVPLPRKAKETHGKGRHNASAYTAMSQSHDGLQQQRLADSLQGFMPARPKGEVHEPNRSSSAENCNASALPTNATNCAPALSRTIVPHRLPAHYDYIPGETIKDETIRFIQWCVDGEKRLQEAKEKRKILPMVRDPVAIHDEGIPPSTGSAFTTVPTSDNMAHLLRHMPKDSMPPVFPSGPLNLNTDGSEINYKKSHAGPNAAHWVNADGEEIERLFTTGTIKPLRFKDIPAGNVVTYVNPVCVEKTNDDGSIKFRTRITIGGDRIMYPYETATVTAEMDALKILLNCMISENANFSTVDLTDFYLGTDLPHPEYIRISHRLIPANTIAFYALDEYITDNALLCSVHKTHYGLPQAGALS